MYLSVTVPGYSKQNVSPFHEQLEDWGVMIIIAWYEHLEAEKTAMKE